MTVDELTLESFANLLASGLIEYADLIENGFDEISMELMVKRSVRYRALRADAGAGATAPDSSPERTHRGRCGREMFAKRPPRRDEDVGHAVGDDDAIRDPDARARAEEEGYDHCQRDCQVESHRDDNDSATVAVRQVPASSDALVLKSHRSE